jgi:uncharacterized delta-60 repeat protein
MREKRIALAVAACAGIVIFGVCAGSALAKGKHLVKRAPRGTVVSRSIFAWDIAVQPDGKLVTVGRNGGRRTRVIVARRLENGQLDPGFGARAVPLPPKTLVYLISIDADGRIVIAGQAPGSGDSSTGSPADFVLARLLQDGELDPSFGSGGVVRTDFGADDSPASLTLQGDGRILLAGRADRGYPDGANPDSSFALARYGHDGSLDPTFGTGGKVLVGFGQYNSALAAVVEPDGKIAVAGYNQVDPGSIDPANFAQARLLPNGGLDPSFGNGGKLVAPLLTPQERAHSFLLGVPVIPILSYTDRGELIVVHETMVRREKRIVGATKVERLTVDGAPDPGFGGNGVSILGPRKMGVVSAARATPDGRIVVSGDGGGFRDGVQVTRLGANGTLDATFGRRGSVITALPGGVEGFPAIAFDSLGRTLVAGQTDAHSRLLSVMARYLPNGRLDRSFGPRHKRRHRKHRRHRH